MQKAHPARYKLIALDLDGTLLLQRSRITERVKRVIQLAMERGIIVTLASARALDSMRPYVEELGITAPIITNQGCRIVMPETRCKIYNVTVPLLSTRTILEYLQSRGLDVIVFANDHLYLRRSAFAEQMASGLAGRAHSVVNDLVSAVRSEATRFVIIGEGLDLDSLAIELEEHLGSLVRFVRSSPRSLEGISLGVSKGTALERVALNLSVPQKQVMAMGDSDNDVEMVAWANLGVAMGNATPAVKAVADYIAPSVDDDGVAVAIEKFCLG